MISMDNLKTLFQYNLPVILLRIFRVPNSKQAVLCVGKAVWKAVDWHHLKIYRCLDDASYVLTAFLLLSFSPKPTAIYHSLAKVKQNYMKLPVPVYSAEEKKSTVILKILVYSTSIFPSSSYPNLFIP